MFEIGNLHKLIRDIPKPVIAAVNGVAVGGGHVLHVLCDVSHRQRDRPLRPGRPEGRLLRRRVRVGLPGPGGRREEGAGDLVLVPDVRRRRGPADGPGEQGGARRPTAGRGPGVGRGDRGEEPHRDPFPQAVLQRRHRSSGRAEQPGHVRARPVHRITRRASKAPPPSPRSAGPTSAGTSTGTERATNHSSMELGMDFDPRRPRVVPHRNCGGSPGRCWPPLPARRQSAGKLRPTLAAEMAGIGLTGLRIPERYGGQEAQRRRRGNGGRGGGPRRLQRNVLDHLHCPDQ